MEELLNKIEELIKEANKSNCPYVGVFELNDLLEEYGRERVEDDE